MAIDLKGIRERVSAATPGPWTPVSEAYRNVVGDECTGIMRVVGPGEYPHADVIVDVEGSGGASNADLEFIASARQDVPALLDLVDELTGALLASEWVERVSSGFAWHECPACHEHHRQHVKTPERPHDPECPLDAALTSAGFPDQASRDAERVARERAKGYAASVRAMEADALAKTGPGRETQCGGATPDETGDGKSGCGIAKR